MLKRIHNDNPDEKKIDEVVKCLENGGIIIYPTDTVYGLGCNINNKKALERIARIKGVKLKDAHFSFICFDLSDLSKYAKQINSRTFKLLKRIFPGPFTIILKGTNKIPKIFSNKKKTVGIPNAFTASVLTVKTGYPPLGRLSGTTPLSSQS